MLLWRFCGGVVVFLYFGFVKDRFSLYYREIMHRVLTTLV